jgi:lipid II:glycine glycyltransferase (peptidoglycan interpeptide bridge formation enzyme)
MTQTSKGTFLKSLSPATERDAASAESFLQSGFWGAFKASFGWTPLYFHADWGGRKPLLALYRPLAAGLGFAYVPWGPELPQDFPADDAARTLACRELALALKPFLPRAAAFVRFDPPWHACGDAPPPALLKPFSRASADIQPPDTVLIDLRDPPDAIIARMKAKWRYNVRLGGRKTCVRRADVGGLDTFYALFRETALRDGIAIHGQAYYARIFEAAADAPVDDTSVDVRLYLAEADGEPLAGIITLFRGRTATYLYGASSSRNRNLMAAYALQWRAICDAKEAGCEEYDMFGIPPDASPTHPMAGLYQFKTGFGGSIIHRPGSWDYAYGGLRTALFRAAEKCRKTLRDTRKRKPR